MTKFMLSIDVFLALRAAGFETQEANRGLHVFGHYATKNGETFICAHDGRGWYPADRVENVINGTAPRRTEY